MIYMLISISKNYELLLVTKIMGTSYLLWSFSLMEPREMTVAKGGFFPPCFCLRDMPPGSQLHCTALSTCEWGRMSLSDPQTALGVRTICSLQGLGAADWPSSSSSLAPVTCLLQMQAAKSWCSLQQLHTAVYPHTITGDYLLRESTTIQLKPCRARPYLALIVFVIYRTTKWGEWWKKFFKVACNALILECRRGSWTVLMKCGMLFFYLILQWKFVPVLVNWKFLPPHHFYAEKRSAVLMKLNYRESKL